ncbi:uncharacterized protein LOC125046835 [Penaeus chinensis]|uniref:uncharacterized protein LOC125046835 n=1 Tax=Penaeus chinensis TaxID=139456 RepID=UPI001FB77FFE|nr:uncharacterized protein LOC125046835 [Penaeus chinensis]
MTSEFSDQSKIVFSESPALVHEKRSVCNCPVANLRGPWAPEKMCDGKLGLIIATSMLSVVAVGLGVGVGLLLNKSFHDDETIRQLREESVSTSLAVRVSRISCLRGYYYYYFFCARVKKGC